MNTFCCERTLVSNKLCLLIVCVSGHDHSTDELTFTGRVGISGEDMDPNCTLNAIVLENFKMIT